MNIPSSAHAGDTWSWTDSLVDYPAPTWTLKYVLWKYGKALISIAATASGTDHAVAVSVATSKAYAPGVWNWTAYVEKGTGATLERHALAKGSIEVEPGFTDANASADFRSHAAKVLAAIEATIEGRATKAMSSITVNGKAITYLKPDELLRWRVVYQRAVAREKGVSTIIRYSFGSD